MKVKVIRPFVGVINGKTKQYRPGEEFNMPAGADWLKAMLVEKVAGKKKQTATSKAAQDRETR